MYELEFLSRIGVVFVHSVKNVMHTNVYFLLYMCSSAYIVIYKARCFDVAQGRMNGVPNETRTHSCRFAGLAC